MLWTTQHNGDVEPFSGICNATILPVAGAEFGPLLLAVISYGQPVREFRLPLAIHNSLTSSAGLVVVSCVSFPQDVLGVPVCISRGFAENNAAKQAAERIEILIIWLKNISGPIKNKIPPKLGPMAVPTARGVVIHPFARP